MPLQQNVSVLLKAAEPGQSISRHMGDIEKIVEEHTENHSLDIHISRGQYHIVLPPECGMAEAHDLVQHLNTLVDDKNHPVLEAEVAFFSTQTMPPPLKGK